MVYAVNSSTSEAEFEVNLSTERVPVQSELGRGPLYRKTSTLQLWFQRGGGGGGGSGSGGGGENDSHTCSTPSPGCLDRKEKGEDSQTVSTKCVPEPWTNLPLSTVPHKSEGVPRRKNMTLCPYRVQWAARFLLPSDPWRAAQARACQFQI